MKHFKLLGTSFLAFVLASVLGCAGTANTESAGEYIDDTWITTRVKAALVGDDLVKATEVNVETFQGVVQLSGFVSSDEAMVQAVQIAQNVKGVTSVANVMQVK